MHINGIIILIEQLLMAGFEARLAVNPRATQLYTTQINSQINLRLTANLKSYTAHYTLHR